MAVVNSQEYPGSRVQQHDNLVDETVKAYVALNKRGKPSASFHFGIGENALDDVRKITVTGARYEGRGQHLPDYVPPSGAFPMPIDAITFGGVKIGRRRGRKA